MNEEMNPLVQKLKNYFDENNRNLADWELVRKDDWLAPNYSEMVAMLQLKMKLKDIDTCVDLFSKSAYKEQLIEFYLGTLDFQKTVEFKKALMAEAEARGEEIPEGEITYGYQNAKELQEYREQQQAEQQRQAEAAQVAVREMQQTPAQVSDNCEHIDAETGGLSLQIPEPVIPRGWQPDEQVERTFKVKCSVRDLMFLSEAMNILKLDYEKV